VDLTVAAIPFYFGSMGAEYLWQRRHAAERGPTAADYEWHDTVASLTMGVGSLVSPLVLPRLVRRLSPGGGRAGRVMAWGVASAVAATSVADLLTRLEPDDGPFGRDIPERGQLDPAPRPSRRWRRRVTKGAGLVSSVGGVAGLAGGIVAVSGAWASRTSARRFGAHRLLPSLGNGPLGTAAAVLAWDFIYYWNHRFMHQSRFLWAVHVVHHSSERYNLSTALRQPVADAFGVFVPYGVLSLVGIDQPLIETARGVNLLYQFWIHTDSIRRIGPFETVLNSPSHHRVHHGSNRRYLDRNHGSILIVWDKLFGTFEPEGEPVVYGLTKNIKTFGPARIATHEYVDMLGDIAASRTWKDRLSFVLRGPGWARRRREELDATNGSQR
jgi:sterol desaturase/sphingolipid hydroxylase (fatty acid hydroxylase superfamily)